MQSLALTKLTELKGVGAKVAEKLTKLGLVSVQDLLFHLPMRYEDRTRVCPIGDLQPFLSIAVEGEVMSCDVQFGRKRMLVARVSDGSGTITLRFFHFSAAQKNNLEKGTHIRAFGEVRAGKFGLEMMHPEYRVTQPGQPSQLEEALTPVYPATEGIKQITLRNLTEQALAKLAKGGLSDLMPDNLYPSQVSLSDALMLVHRPAPDVSMTLLEEGRHPAQQRLIIEELLAHNLSVLKVRMQSKRQHTFSIKTDTGLIKRFFANLTF